MAPERGGSVRRSSDPTTSREVSFGPGDRQDKGGSKEKGVERNKDTSNQCNW